MTLTSLGALGASETGSRWVLRAETSDAELLLVGEGLSGRIVAQSGVTTLGSGRLVESIPDTGVSITDGGFFATMVNLSGAVFTDDTLVTGQTSGPVNFEVEVQEPENIGLIDSVFKGGSGSAPKVTLHGD
ncbi:MAG: hypothetical protein AAGB34_09365, partial [Planctomycetota bacterium]